MQTNLLADDYPTTGVSWKDLHGDSSPHGEAGGQGNINDIISIESG